MAACKDWEAPSAVEMRDVELALEEDGLYCKLRKSLPAVSLLSPVVLVVWLWIVLLLAMRMRDAPPPLASSRLPLLALLTKDDRMFLTAVWST
jgi:hypothetical protein